MVRSVYACLCLVVLTTSAVYADKVDDVVKEHLEKQRVPGVSIAVVRDGKVIKAQGYGFANLEHKVPATADTIYQSGSVGKQFTAALVMLLVSDGKIGLDDSITKYFPDSPDAWKPITIRHLLTHTSGFGDPYDKLDLRKDYTDEELLKLYATIPLEFQPGEKWQYSNMAYHVLGFLCNKVGGKFYGDQLKERIFTPLKMDTARIINEADIVPNRAAGYRLVQGQIKNQEWVSPSLSTTADGSLYLTVKDMAKWDIGLNTDVPLSKSIREQSWTPVKLNDGKTYPYGFGWGLGEINGHKTIEHSGAWQGFTTYIVRYPDDHLSVIVLTNSASGGPVKLGRAIAATYIPALTPPVPKPIEDKEPKITALLRDILLKTADGTVTADAFTKETAEALFPDRVKQAGDFLKTMGALKSLTLLETGEQGEERVYRYRVEYTGSKFLLFASLTKENKIAGFALSPDQ